MFLKNILTLGEEKKTSKCNPLLVIDWVVFLLKLRCLLMDEWSPFWQAVAAATQLSVVIRKTRMTSPSRSAWQGILHLLRLRKRRNFWTHRKPPRVLIHLTWSSLNCLNFQCSNFPEKTKWFLGILDFGWFQGLWTPSNHFCRKVINIFFLAKSWPNGFSGWYKRAISLNRITQLPLFFSHAS